MDIAKLNKILHQMYYLNQTWADSRPKADYV